MTDLHKEALQRILEVQRTAINDSDAWTEVKLLAREALAAPVVPASFTDEDMKASWLTGFKEAEFQFRGGTEKSGEFPAKTPLSVAPQAAPPKQPSVPPGYALVPVEPTPEMLQVFSVQDHYAVRYSKRNPRDKLYEVFSRETIDVVEAFGSEDLADELAARLSSMQRYRAMLAAAPQPKDKP